MLFILAMSHLFKCNALLLNSYSLLFFCLRKPLFRLFAVSEMCTAMHTSIFWRFIRVFFALKNSVAITLLLPTPYLHCAPHNKSFSNITVM